MDRTDPEGELISTHRERGGGEEGRPWDGRQRDGKTPFPSNLHNLACQVDGSEGFVTAHELSRSLQARGCSSITFVDALRLMSGPAQRHNVCAHGRPSVHGTAYVSR